MTIKYSDNRVFAIDDRQEHNLFIKKQHVDIIKLTNPNLFSNLTNIKHKNKNFSDYEKFTVNIDFKKLPNDCLMLAEGIASGNLQNLDNTKAILRVDEPKQRLFGHTDKQNITIANEVFKELNKGSNDKLFHTINPDINDAYVMMPLELDLSGQHCPYHAAAVIFKDENTRITLEADAGANMKKPVFDMYSTLSPTKSFYSKFSEMYTVNGKKPAIGKLIHRDKIGKKTSRVKNNSKLFRKTSKNSSGGKKIRK